MKVLVVSLLRAGDLIMQLPLVEAIRKDSPEADIHILLNDEVSWVSQLLETNIKVHVFPRKSLQRQLGEADHHLMRAPFELGKLINELNTIGFDKIYNFTHTRLSAFLCEEIFCQEKMGLHSEGPKFYGLESPWIRFFNDRFSSNLKFPFHYTEILAKSFGLKLSPPPHITAGKKHRVLIQTLTSDVKKNWSLLNFRKLLNLLYSLSPETEFRILCAESDKKKLLNYFEDEELCTWDLATLNKEFCSKDILISGDTAVMHLAARKGVQVIELCLGPSDPWRTGPLGEGHLILKSDAPCAPCPASKACKQRSHLCGESISALMLAKIVHSCLLGKDIEDFSSKNMILQSKSSKAGYRLLSNNIEEQTIFLQKIIWEAVMEKKDSILEEISELSACPRDLSDAYHETHEILVQLQSDFEGLIFKLGQNDLKMTDVQNSRILMAKIKVQHQIAKDWIWSFHDLAKMSFASPLHFLSAYQDRLEQLKAIIFLMGEVYESRIGRIPSERSQEA